MSKNNKKLSFIIGFMVAILSFVLLLVGFKYILSNQISIQNVISYIILSIIFGGLATSLYLFKFKTSLLIFLGGIVIGFVDMYRSFMNGMSGWGDLVGFMSLLTWSVIGLIVGLVIQIIYHLYKKAKNKSKE